MGFQKRHLVWVAVGLSVLWVPAAVRGFVEGCTLESALLAAGMLALCGGLALYATKGEPSLKESETPAGDPLLPKKMEEGEEKEEEKEETVVVAVGGEETAVN